MGTFLLVILIIILMLLSTFVGIIAGMFMIVLSAANAMADSIAGTVPNQKLKDLGVSFTQLVKQALSKRHGITGVKITYDVNVDSEQDGEV